MKRSVLAQALLLTVPFVFGTTNHAHAQSYSVIYNLGDHTGDPLNPQELGVIAQGRDGNLYTTTPSGGSGRTGTAFNLTPGGKLKVLTNFGPQPYSGLSLGTDGNFYGSTYYGGTSNAGTLFRITTKGTLTTLYSFAGGNDGANPWAPPIQAWDGNFYGTTQNAGLHACGTAYKITPKGKLTTLFEFNGAPNGGCHPIASLIQAADGNLYGTTTYGGTNNTGTVFKMTLSGAVTFVYSFDNAYYYVPQAALVQASDGNFYGTTPAGGTGKAGLVFKITPKGVFTVLHSLNGTTDGAAPYAGLVQASDGNLYGAAFKAGNGYGTIFKMTTAGKFSVIHNFDGADGSSPAVALIQQTNGVLYGNTYSGGDIHNTGVSFRVKISATPFVSLLPILGKVAATIDILGQGFTGVTDVSFNGTSATFTVVNNTFLTATVPDSATTGFVTIKTPSGTLTSNKKFVVKK
jgi:uncharacterized repeat protein (TIGR03803 family)